MGSLSVSGKVTTSEERLRDVLLADALRADGRSLRGGGSKASALIASVGLGTVRPRVAAEREDAEGTLGKALSQGLSPAAGALDSEGPTLTSRERSPPCRRWRSAACTS